MGIIAQMSLIVKSGSEVCAAIIEGTFEEIVGVELIQNYVDIAEARMAFWASQSRQMKMGI